MTHPESACATRFVYIYIDNSNLWIEGKKTSAKRTLHPSVTTDTSWRFDVGKLIEVIIHNSGLQPSWQNYRHKTTLYGSIPPPSDSVWDAIRAHDVEVKIFPRSQHNNREKQVDGQLITDAVKRAGRSSYMGQPCEFIIVSGDLDFKPAVLEIVNCGFRVHVWSWKSGMAWEYAQLLHTQVNTGPVRVHCLDGYLNIITLRKRPNIVQHQTSCPYGFVILSPALKMNHVLWYLGVLEYRIMFSRYWLCTKWDPSEHFDVVVIPERIFNLGWWNSLFMEAQATMNAVGLAVVTFSQYTENNPLWRALSGRTAMYQAWTAPTPISNEYNGTTNPHHMEAAFTDASYGEVNYPRHRPDVQMWPEENSRRRINGLPREPYGRSTYPWPPVFTNKRPLPRNERMGAKRDNGGIMKCEYKKRMCPFGKACMNGDSCVYSHS